MRFVVPLTVIFHVRSTNQPTITGVALFHKNLDAYLLIQDRFLAGPWACGP